MNNLAQCGLHQALPVPASFAATADGSYKHMVFFSSTTEEHFASVTPYIQTGLEQGEKCLYIANDNTVEDVLERLRSGGIDVDTALQSEALTVCRSEQVYLRDGVFDPDNMLTFLEKIIREAQAKGFTGLRGTGEMSWVLANMPRAEYRALYEEKVNNLFADYPNTVLCQYDRERFSADTILDIIRTYPFILIDGVACRNPYFIPLKEFLQTENSSREIDRFLAVIKDMELAERAKRDSEGRCRTLVNFAYDWEYWASDDGRVLVISPSCERITGYTPGEFLDSPQLLEKIVYPEDIKKFRELIANAEGKEFTLGEFRITRRDGEVRWIGHANQKVTDETGASLGTRVSNRDITSRKLAEQAVQKSEEHYRRLIELAGEGIWVVDADDITEYVNETMADMLGWQVKDMLGRPLSDFMGDLLQLSAEGAEEETPEKDFKFVRPDGTEIWTIITTNPIIDEYGNYAGAVGMLSDITARKRAELALKVHTSAMNAAGDQIIITDIQGRIIYVNEAFESEMGYDLKEVVDKPQGSSILDHIEASTAVGMWEAVHRGDTWHGEIVSHRKDGSACTEDMTVTPVRGSKGGIEHFIAIKRDATERKKHEEQLQHMAHHDPLTGLPNRLLFGDRLSQRLAQARRKESMMAVMYLDLDKFKSINDTLGHDVGDLLLRTVSERLTTALREVDTIARMGGDEFTILMSDVANEQEVVKVAKRIIAAMAPPFMLNERKMKVSTSVGISIYPADGTDVESLVKKADMAMYRAKQEGRNKYRLYAETLNTAVAELRSMEQALRNALDNDQFILHYLPRVDIKTGRMSGVEALVRWQHPELGMLQPGQFIPQAEETGLILPITERVVRLACQQGKHWQECNYELVDMGVNISDTLFKQQGFAAALKDILSATNFDPARLTVDITEKALLEKSAQATEFLETLNRMGVRITLDDFGTGVSSLSHLKSYPIDSVKIDRSFIANVSNNITDATMVQAVVMMAHSLGIQVIGEGVETVEQWDFLRSTGCDHVQGYFISCPVPAVDIEPMLYRQAA